MWYWAMIDGENDGRCIAGGQPVPQRRAFSELPGLIRSLRLLKQGRAMTKQIFSLNPEHQVGSRLGLLLGRGSDSEPIAWPALTRRRRRSRPVVQVPTRARQQRAGCCRSLSLVANARAAARLGEINRAVNLSIRATSDWAQYGVDDFWSAPIAK
jgi:predicted transglutaminase-like cysteine proteinase